MGSIELSFRVCLVGGKIGRKEEKGEKSGEMMFFVGVWLEVKEENKFVGFGCFLPRPTKMFSPQIGEKTREKMFGQKTPLCYANVLGNLGF